jgi:Na+/H+ antiporter NhaC
MMFFSICAVIFVLGIAFTLSGYGIKSTDKVSDADRELADYDETRFFGLDPCSNDKFDD